MYGFDDEKVFVDSVDDQLVALVIETGSYYTFSEAATAVVNDLAAGYEPAEVAAALATLPGGDGAAEKLDAFLAQAVEKGILCEVAGAAPAERPALTCADLDLSDGLELDMEGYDDVAEYFMIDPIHEVDPDMGWPYSSQE